MNESTLTKTIAHLRRGAESKDVTMLTAEQCRELLARLDEQVDKIIHLRHMIDAPAETSNEN